MAYGRPLDAARQRAGGRRYRIDRFKQLYMSCPSSAIYLKRSSTCRIGRQGRSDHRVNPPLPPSHVLPSTGAFVRIKIGNLPSSISAKSASQPLERAGTLVVPEISLYKGVRFKRSIDARENAFSLRANGVTRSRKAPKNTRAGNMDRSGVRWAACLCLRNRPPESVRCRTRMGMLICWSILALDEAVVPTPTSIPQRPGEAPIVASTASIVQVRPPTVQSNIVADDNPPPSTRSAPSSTETHISTSCSNTTAGPHVQPAVHCASACATPMSLVGALNKVRREKLQSPEAEGRGPGRRWNNVDPTGALSHFIFLFSFSSSLTYAAERQSASQGLNEVSATTSSSPQPSTPSPSTSQQTRAFGRTPSLNEIRALMRRKPTSSYLHVHAKVYVQ